MNDYKKTEKNYMMFSFELNNTLCHSSVNVLLVLITSHNFFIHNMINILLIADIAFKLLLEIT